MHIHSKKSWELRESLVTSETAYRNRSRREFLRTIGAGLAGAAVAPHLLAATRGFPSKRNPAYGASLKPTDESFVTGYNNFYEFGLAKTDPKIYANRGWKTEPWTVEIAGAARNKAKIDVNDLVDRMGGIEQRIYRHRCVEAWSMVVPWDGFPLARLVAFADPLPEAKFIKFVTFLDPKVAPGQADQNIGYPYVEGLRLDEAMHGLSFIATGVFGKPLPNQNGAPLRLVTPWKYGFKGIKSIVRIEFTATQPRNTWQIEYPGAYGFYANVNPAVRHPNWEQNSETVIGEGSLLFPKKQPTLNFNGYEKEVAALYRGMDPKTLF